MKEENKLINKLAKVLIEIAPFTSTDIDEEVDFYNVCWDESNRYDSNDTYYNAFWHLCDEIEYAYGASNRKEKFNEIIKNNIT